MRIKLRVGQTLEITKPGLKMAGERDVRQAYSYVRIVAEGGIVRFEFVNSRAEFVVDVEDVEIKQGGHAIVDASILQDILESLHSDAIIDIETTEEFAIVTKGLFYAKLAMLKDEEFPNVLESFDNVDDVAIFKVAPEFLMSWHKCKVPEIVGYSQYAGILFDYGDSRIVVGGFSPTQVHMLFESEFEVDLKGLERLRVVVPYEMINLIESFADRGERIELGFDLRSGKGFIRNSVTKARFGLMEDMFPESYVQELGVMDVFKKDFKGVIVKKREDGSKKKILEPRVSTAVLTEDFVGSVKVVRSVLLESDPSIVVQIKKEADNWAFNVVADSKMAGSEAKNGLVLDTDGLEVAIGMNISRLEAVLRCFESKRKVELWIKDGRMSVIFAEYEPEFEHLRFVAVLVSQMI